MQTIEQTESTVQEQLEERAGLVGGKAWGVAQGKPRIYMQYARKDVKVFVGYPDHPTGCDEDQLGGPKLSVHIDDCGQHPNWYAGQRAKIQACFHREFLALCILANGDPPLAWDLMDQDGDDLEITGEVLDEAGGHSTNGRFAEAREVLNL